MYYNNKDELIETLEFCYERDCVCENCLPHDKTYCRKKLIYLALKFLKSEQSTNSNLGEVKK